MSSLKKIRWTIRRSFFLVAGFFIVFFFGVALIFNSQLNVIQKALFEISSTGEPARHMTQETEISYLKEEAYGAVKVISSLSLLLPLFLLAASLVIGYVISRWIIQPIINLESITMKIAEGNLNIKIDIGSSNEVGDLTKSIELMVNQIKRMNSQTELKYSKIISSTRLITLGEMAGGIAHEINNPIGVINGKANLLLKYLKAGKFTDEIGSEQLQKIILMTNRVATIVKGLRLFSRNADSDSFTIVNLNTLVANVLSFCSEKFNAQKIKIELEILPDVSMECRSTQIEQVLLNLLNNAYDAVMPLAEKWVRIVVKNTNNIQISVTDSGQGIPSDVVEKMMQPFFTTKEIGRGVGLGLSISKGIIEDHHGTLAYNSLSTNTCFVISLPMKQ